MELKTILEQRDHAVFHQLLKQNDRNYQHRLQLLKEAASIFRSNQKLSQMSASERSLFLGQNSTKNNPYEFDVNLFGAPGGNGEVKSVIASKYTFLDVFFAAIPRTGVVTTPQYRNLVSLFKQGIEASGCTKFPLVLFTRILTITRPDTFVSSAAKALEPICKALGVKQVKDTESYWNQLLPELHKNELFSENVGVPDTNYLALLDGIVWGENENKINEEIHQYSTKEPTNKLKLAYNPLNSILYGPPGTGKTYHTIEAAVKAAEPSFSWHSREDLKAEYDRLVSDKRIRFVTFHQSYGYEEFVEGLRAVSNQDNQIEYQIQSGIFKQICQDATASAINQPSALKPNAKIWKLSIDGVKSSRVRDYCFANNLAAIGWGETGDMSSEDRSAEEQDYFEGLGALAKSSVMEFSNRMAEGDIVICVKGQWSIQAVGVVSGDYQFREEGVEDRSDFCHVMPVDWLATGLDVNLYELNDNTRLTLKTCYELTRFTSIELYEVLEKSGVKLKSYSQADSKRQNYVLVIDEINRGNISKVFGELITLIEPSKRKGKEEALELTLPYSGKPFSVPDNLYIIGAMNTADRSLAMMDTALRRRFDFIEMMPKPELLANTVVDDIDLEELLTVLNERIEILYDREHTLGHAFFMPVKKLVDANQQEKAFTALVSVFQNKIIPLLEEYFFEDWDKIRLVLADNQKAETLQFVSEKPLNNSKLSALFGNKHGLNQYGETQKQYILKKKSDSVWKDAQAYKAIYPSSDKQGE
ncbi:AAA family ATPase [Aliivibrio fischeri]|uniref:AAA family ATPase n=1 Tax=Aliivibrio fischeri TaxID=668 RepID=UPI0007C45B41|nr:AAA family ATPase [Aliivibrio fischeri]